MDVLATYTLDLKEKLVNTEDEKFNKDIIFKHIEKIEKHKFIIDDFHSDSDWFNTSKPLTKSLLWGKIVILDFFTYCCINCLHMIPILKKLEKNFSISDGVVVIGVHSAKFENEKVSQNILMALKKYNITHPVINDKNCDMWNKLNISCWPTLLILGPQRQPIFALLGEGHSNELFLFVKYALRFYEKSISTHELPLHFSDQIVTSSFLSFPGKLARWKNIFALSDSGNHRILIFDEKGILKFKIGVKKQPGFKDGTFEKAQFDSPQGLIFYDSNKIYIADTNNHAIRLANIETLEVITVVGNGNQGTDIIGGNIGFLQSISSPWDLCIVPCSDIELPKNESNSTSFFSVLKYPRPVTSPFESDVHSCGSSVLPPPFLLSTPPPPPPPPNFSESSILHLTQTKDIVQNETGGKVLLIAAAGTHQIWAYFIDSGIWWKGKKYEKNVCVAVAGSGKEENRNNSYSLMASFAQPSGLAYSSELKAVFVADSESSCIRKISLSDGRVSHVAGGTKFPNDLFGYGDIDGKGYDAKLQHPLGIAWHSRNRSLFICDSFNHKIKEIDVTDGRCKTINLNLNCFCEPNGCCLNENDDVLFVCDTNNNCLKTIDLKDYSFEVTEETLTVATSLKDIWTLKTNINTLGGSVILKINFTPQEIHGKWKVDINDSDVIADFEEGNLISNFAEINLKFGPSEKENIFSIKFNIILCGNEACILKTAMLKVQVSRSEKADKNVICEINKNFT